ncbi:MAG: translation initiation factor IF-2 subunit beta [Nanoarchaeota archaeon]|nr:translation initiation factor IF-2 subunit beta [Nanoarchaeota archaeon]
MKYEELLERAMKKIPKDINRGERFNPPAVESFIEGNRTIVTNLHALANYLNRDLNHIVKFLAKELAAPGNVDGKRVIFIGKFPNKVINEKVQLYIKQYVRCKECGSPDTKFEKEDRILMLHCMACQARYPVPKVK